MAEPDLIYCGNCGEQCEVTSDGACAQCGEVLDEELYLSDFVGWNANHITWQLAQGGEA